MNYTHDKKIKKPFREVIDMLSNELNSIGQVENPKLHEVAQEVDQKLKNVLSRI